jgi:hypothetical protein
MLDFPTSPALNQKFPQPAVAGVPVYTWDGEKWAVTSSASGGAGGSDVTQVYVDAQDALKVAKAGDIMTGNLSIANVNPTFSLNKEASGGVCQSYIMTNGSVRWMLRYSDADPESGGNAGSSFRLYAYSDVGTNPIAALDINRATGNVVLTGAITAGQTEGLAASFGNTGRVRIYGDQGAGVGAKIDFNTGNGGCLATGAGSGASIRIMPGLNSGTATIFNYDGSVSAHAVNIPNVGRLSFAQNNVGTSAWQAMGANNAMTFVGGAGGTLWYNNVANKPIMGLTDTGGMAVGGGPYASIGVGLNLSFTGGGVQYGMGFRPVTDNTIALIFHNSSDLGVGTIGISTTATTYSTTSDERLKEDLKSFDAGTIIDNTKVFDFAWKSTKERSFGVIAQQAVKVYPQAVTYSNGQGEDMWGVDYSKYVPVLLQELKALRARVAQLEGKPPVTDKK